MVRVFEPPPFHPSRPGLVRPVRVDASGVDGPTRGQARGPGWVKVAHGWYVPTYVDRDQVCQRILESSVHTPPGGAVTGWAALRWEHGRWFDGSRRDGTLRDVTVATAGQTVREQPGTRTSEEQLWRRDVTVLDGLAITRSVRSVTFEMRHADTVDQAVGVLDMAAYSDLVSVSQTAGYVSTMLPVTGIIQCRKALPLASENSWSWQETRMRLAWQRAFEGVPLRCNVPVFDSSGRHVGTPDLLDPEAGVVGEYDGAPHLTGGRRAHDLGREHAFRQVGLEPVTMVAGDWADLGRFLARVRGVRPRRAPRAATLDDRTAAVVDADPDRRPAAGARSRDPRAAARPPRRLTTPPVGR